MGLYSSGAQRRVDITPGDGLRVASDLPMLHFPVPLLAFSASM